MSEESSYPTGGERREGIDRRLLELLVCPLTKTPLEYDEARQELISRAARLAFPIKEGVPLMTVEAARHLDDEEQRS
ncbi:MAG TPA: Trm112 family protein [Hyphomicrobiaceae bacterium]|nr:Trm112 family protein [Hyphomicrobiaceae bacterium]